MKRIILMAAVTGCLLTGCDDTKRGAEEAVRKVLKDPDSAKFGDFYYNAELKRACLTVNAKNGMGGYTGDQQVSLLDDKDGWAWIASAEQTQETCRKNWADNSQLLN